MDTILHILRVIGVIFLVLMTFNLLIVVHEWGHFLAARWRGLQVDRFQIWFGKPLWKKTVNGVQYGLGSIPAGGFVALPQMAPMESIEGENLNEGENAEPRDLPPITPLDKIIVAFAGPLFSFLLAICFATVVHFVGKPVNEASNTTVVGIIGEGTPAAASDLKVGDKIISIDGAKVKNFTGMINSVQWSIASSTSNPIVIQVERPNEGSKKVEITMPTAEEKAKAEKVTWLQSLLGRPSLRKIGVGPQRTPVIMSVTEPGPGAEAGLQAGDIVKKVNGQAVHSLMAVWKYEEAHLGEALVYSVVRGKDKQQLELTVVPRLPLQGVAADKKDQPHTGILWDGAGIREIAYPGIFDQVANSLKMMKNTLGAIVTPKSEVSVSHLSGPVGIMNLYYNLFNMEGGWRLVLWFSVIMNVNLAVLNMLPFPVLDGGHITMAFFEWISRKPMKFRILEMVQTAFVILLLGFMAFVSIKDVKNVSDQVMQGDDETELRFGPKEASTAAPAAKSK